MHMTVSNLKYGEEFPKFPESLNELRVFDCKALTSLPELPEGLSCLWVIRTALTSLPKLPNGLKELRIGACLYLHSIPELPKGLKELRVGACRALTNLPEFPECLSQLYVLSCEALTSLPELPDGLNFLDVDTHLKPKNWNDLETVTKRNTSKN